MTDKTADFEEPCPDVVTAGDLVGLRREEWPPERLRALDREVAEARGWTDIRPCPDTDEHHRNCWFGNEPGATRRPLPEVSLGCRETFDLMEEEKIEVSWVPAHRDWWARRWGAAFEAAQVGPTPAIAICLAYLASKGRPFNG